MTVSARGVVAISGNKQSGTDICGRLFDGQIRILPALHVSLIGWQTKELPCSARRSNLQFDGRDADVAGHKRCNASPRGSWRPRGRRIYGRGCSTLCCKGEVIPVGAGNHTGLKAARISEGVTHTGWWSEIWRTANGGRTGRSPTGPWTDIGSRRWRRRRRRKGAEEREEEMCATPGEADHAAGSDDQESDSWVNTAVPSSDSECRNAHDHDDINSYSMADRSAVETTIYEDTDKGTIEGESYDNRGGEEGHGEGRKERSGQNMSASRKITAHEEMDPRSGPNAMIGAAAPPTGPPREDNEAQSRPSSSSGLQSESGSGLQERENSSSEWSIDDVVAGAKAEEEEEEEEEGGIETVDVGNRKRTANVTESSVQQIIGAAILGTVVPLAIVTGLNFGLDKNSSYFCALDTGGSSKSSTSATIASAFQGSSLSSLRWWKRVEGPAVGAAGAAGVISSFNLLLRLGSTKAVVAKLLAEIAMLWRTLGGAGLVGLYLRTVVFGKTLRVIEWDLASGADHPLGRMHSISIRQPNLESVKRKIAAANGLSNPACIKQLALWLPQGGDLMEPITSTREMALVQDYAYIVWCCVPDSEIPIPPRGNGKMLKVNGTSTQECDRLTGSPLDSSIIALSPAMDAIADVNTAATTSVHPDRWLYGATATGMDEVVSMLKAIVEVSEASRTQFDGNPLEQSSSLTWSSSSCGKGNGEVFSDLTPSDNRKEFVVGSMQSEELHSRSNDGQVYKRGHVGQANLAGQDQDQIGPSEMRSDGSLSSSCQSTEHDIGWGDRMEMPSRDQLEEPSGERKAENTLPAVSCRSAEIQQTGHYVPFLEDDNILLNSRAQHVSSLKNEDCAYGVVGEFAVVQSERLQNPDEPFVAQRNSDGSNEDAIPCAESSDLLHNNDPMPNTMTTEEPLLLPIVSEEEENELVRLAVAQDFALTALFRAFCKESPRKFLHHALQRLRTTRS